MTEIAQRFKSFADRLADFAVQGKEGYNVKEGGWTVAQVIHHITDATVMYLSRVLLVLSNETPTLVPFDQDMLASYPFSSDDRSILSLEIPLLQHLCNKFALILDGLSVEQIKRTGFHPEIGEVSLEDLAKRCIEHNESHLRQIQAVLGD